ncbi:hypothetical protein BaRGS_00002281 [Batillaria attramentaria]|uniref:Death domain-containing protein n=1 Tax=Batillaria attramentaria TaxID=370345 RepID=A0ABD0M488_9CAEN
MGVYSSSFVISPQNSSAVSKYSHPSKANWITAHAIATELSIAEVERLWLRFQQMGCNQDGVLTTEAMMSPSLTSDVFVKNILKYFKTQDGKITFETFLRALKWCEVQDLQVKTRGLFQMLNNGNPIPKELFQRIMSRVYPNDRPEEVQRVTNIFFKTVDKRGKGQLEEGDFVQTVMALPRDSVMSILNFHILPENMRENVHRNLPEFSSRQVGYSPAPGFSPMSAVGPEPSSQVPSDPILNEIAQRIHRRDWDLLANRLGFMADDIDNYRQMYPSSSAQQVFQMLKDWKSREGRQARSDVLERALRNTGMTDASLLLSP